VRSAARGAFRSPLALVAVLFLVLLAAAILAAPAENAPPYDFDSAEATGLRALRLWLGEMGYTVQDTGRAAFTLPDEADLLFVFPGVEEYTAEEASALRRWVESGRTLVLAAPNDPALAQEFGVNWWVAPTAEGKERQVQPLLPDAAESWGGPYLTDGLGLDDAPDAVPVAAAADGTPTVAVQAVGRGTVWQMSGRYSLVNEMLRERYRALLVPALLRAVPPGGVVLFDEYHLRGRSEAAARIESLQDWLYRTPLGLATLFGLLAAGLFWLSSGRRLGPALPEAHTMRRREAAETVVALAALHRRAGQQQAAARHYKRRLKQTLGGRLHVGPELDDAAFVERVRPALGDAAAQQLAHGLAVLERDDEGQIVKAVAELDALLQDRSLQDTALRHRSPH
jgi:hypothetical protein